MAALVQPRRQRQQDAYAKHQRHAHDADLIAEHPQEEGGRSVEREGHELLESVHPGARTRQEAGQRGRKGQYENRQGHAEAERKEHEHRHDPGLGQGESERGAHERRGARRRDYGRQYAGEKRTLVALLRGQAVAGSHQSRADLEYTGQTQAESKEQVDDEGEEPGLLELEGPADLLSRRAQGNQHRGEQYE